MPSDAKARVVDQSKKIAILPFSTRRKNGLSGPIARQIPALMADALASRAHPFELVSWFAERGSARAHVLAEGRIPVSTVHAEMEARGCPLGLSGHVEWDDGTWTGSLEVHRASGGSASVLEASARDLDTLVRALIEALLSHLELDPTAGVQLPATEEALTAWLCDRDAWALVERFELDALVEPDHAWQHLVEVIERDAEFLPARRTLEDRIATWREAGLTRLVAGASMTLARTTHRSEDWASAARDAESDGDTDRSESALRGMLADEPSENSALLKLGVLLVRQSRNSEAIAYLKDALRHDDVRDLAETYLGVALASTGELDRAVEHWQRVVNEGSDDRAKRIARENLARARSH